MVCSSRFLTRSSMRIQAWPVHQTRPIPMLGSAGGSTNVSSREVSKDRGSVVRRRLNLSMTSS